MYNRSLFNTEQFREINWLFKYIYIDIDIYIDIYLYIYIYICMDICILQKSKNNRVFWNYYKSLFKLTRSNNLVYRGIKVIWDADDYTGEKKQNVNNELLSYCNLKQSKT